MFLIILIGSIIINSIEVVVRRRLFILLLPDIESKLLLYEVLLLNSLKVEAVVDKDKGAFRFNGNKLSTSIGKGKV